jgi:hypothetical protein
VVWFAFAAAHAFSAIRFIGKNAKGPRAEEIDVIVQHSQRALADKWLHRVRRPSENSLPINSFAATLCALCRPFRK